MKSQVLTVQWHEGRAPIYSVDMSKKSCLLATGGQDMKVLLWKITGTQVEHVATLDEHVSTVNCVKWDPTGTLLCSATDGGENYSGQLLIWSQEPTTGVWRVVTRCQVPRDIYDVSWNPEGTKIAAVGTDTKLRVFDASNGKQLDEFTPHSHYIQGVAWDPQNQIICSQSMDRTLTVHSWSPRSTRKLRDFKVGEESVTFLDEKTTSYFRRLKFTPDGEFLIAPTANLGELKCTAVFSREALAQGTVSAILPLTTHPSILVACSPHKYEHKGEKLVDLDYSCIYAVATQFMVLIYSTQSHEPICIVGDLHPTAFTDLVWAPDGQSIILSSMEGFCSVISFENGDLPSVLPQESAPPGTTGAPTNQNQTKTQNPKPDTPLINMLTARRKPKPAKS